MKYYSTFSHYRQAWDDSMQKMPPIPLNLDIELSAVCNLQCPTCFVPTQDHRKNVVNSFMPFDLAMRLITEAKNIGIPAVKFNWRGEPTLHQEFTKIMQFAVRGKVFYDILINTNGNCPDKSIEGLKYTTKCMFSVDTLNKELYAKMRKRGGIRTVIETIRRVVEMGHDNVWVRRIITDVNKKEDFKEMVRVIFGDGYVKVSEHYCFDRSKKYDGRHRPTRTYCGYPSQRLVVATDGKVFACCVDYDEKYQVGDVYHQSLLEIWHGSRMNELRENLRNDLANDMELCKTCTSFMSYVDARRDHVQDREL